MAEIRNLAWLRTEVAFQVNFGQDNPNEDFGGQTGDPWTRIDIGINRAYRTEWRKAVNEVGGTRFWDIETVVWPAAQVTLQLPGWLNDTSIMYIDDETDSQPGTRVFINPRWSRGASSMYTPELSWRDHDTLQWVSDGPARDTSLLFTYVAEPRKLKDELDEPTLIPYAHRDVIVQSAAVILRFFSEDSAPAEWKAELKDLRQDFWASISSSRPRDPIGNRIRGA